MKLRFISPTMHGVADYSAGLGLILFPIILNLGESSDLAFWFSIGTGIAVWIASALTNYKLGLLRTIPFEGHLAIDLLVAATFMAVPFLFSFQGIDAYYYWINAAVVFLVVSLSDSNESIKTII
ncbi:hypothetical protein QQ008_02870 [Fulvivirgaceae bacterium BMA10]|uniref:SPW repeat-containing protein n=1 Tax=Splendidivirga corallicola TaxID=3051826 RepID=A0ABT8KHT3_9BACT|nr:hypothetical protein [Fulvivirgaceae bacterium BMA10]